MNLPMTGRFVDPRIVVTHFHLREGDLVAEFGAGSGHFMYPLSQLVGRSGKVYAFEIQKELVTKLGIHAQEQRLHNVHPVWCDIEAKNGTKLADEALDAGVLSNTLFQLTNKQAAAAEIARVMRKGAKLFVIDWTDSFGGLGPQPNQIIKADDVKLLFENVGFSFDRTFDAGGHHFGLAFRRK